jgi:hypothetical protein
MCYGARFAPETRYQLSLLLGQVEPYADPLKPTFEERYPVFWHKNQFAQFADKI